MEVAQRQTRLTFRNSFLSDALRLNSHRSLWNPARRKIVGLRAASAPQRDPIREEALAAYA